MMNQQEAKQFFQLKSYPELQDSYENYLRALLGCRLGDPATKEYRHKVISYLQVLEDIIAERQAR